MLSQIHSVSASLIRATQLRWIAGAVTGTLIWATMNTVAVAQGGNTKKVQVAPQTITVDPKTKIAEVQFTNTGHDSARVDVAVQYMSPGGAKGDSAKNDSAKSDSLAKLWSLASWIQDAPKQLVLAPHETRTVKLHLEVPSKLTPGDYSAYVVVTNVASGAPIAMSFGTGLSLGSSGTASASGTVTPVSSPPEKPSSKLVYHSEK